MTLQWADMIGFHLGGLNHVPVYRHILTTNLLLWRYPLAGYSICFRLRTWLISKTSLPRSRLSPTIPGPVIPQPLSSTMNPQQLLSRSLLQSVHRVMFPRLLQLNNTYSCPPPHQQRRHFQQQPTGIKIWPGPGPGLPFFGRDRDSAGIGIWPGPGAGTGIFGRDF